MIAQPRIAAFTLCALLCAACEKPAVEPMESLVGSETLPPVSVLAHEVIQITRSAENDEEFGPFHLLSYELRPNNTLSVTHLLRGYPEDETIGEESFHLSPAEGQRIRQALWRLRPRESMTVADMKWWTRPSGCERWGPHDQGDVFVSFVDERDTRDVTDDHFAVFELPGVTSCNNRYAKEAGALVIQVLSLLPQSRVAQDFPKSA